MVMREGGSVPIVLPSKANFDSMSFLPLFLFVAALQPVAAGWADILRTTTATTHNPDKPGILRLLVTEDWKQKENMIFYEVFLARLQISSWTHLGHRSFLLKKTWGTHRKKSEGHREFCLSLLRMWRIDEIGDGNCKSKSHSISGNFHILTVANTIHKKLLINYCDTEIIDKCANQSIHCWFW